jgi:lipopolysaccharide heptosyltransferase II
MSTTVNPNWQNEWAQAKRILAIRLDSLGDVLMTAPALRAIRESPPTEQLTLLTSTAGREAGLLLDVVDDIVAYAAPWMKPAGPRADGSADMEMIERLRAGRFDTAVIFTVYSQSPLPAAMLCYLAGIPLRLAHCRENPYHLLTHWVPETEPEQGIRHEVRRQLDLVARVGYGTSDERISLHVLEPAIRAVEASLAEGGVDRRRPWLVLHPGASAPSRRYPAALFAQAIRRLAEEDNFQIVYSGSVEEIGLVQEIQSISGIAGCSLAGRLGVQQLAALLSIAPLLVSNNTGPVHLAAGVETPVVDLYALTNPQHTPWAVPARVLSHDVPCAYCYKSVCPEGHQHCLTLVTPNEVVEAVRELTAESGRLSVMEALPG